MTVRGTNRPSGYGLPCPADIFRQDNPLPVIIRLLLLVIAVLIAELALLIHVGTRIGTPATIGLVLFTGLAGIVVAKLEGLRTLNNARRDLAAGRFPGDRLFSAVLIFIGAVLLVMPGVMTDLIGLLLLLPPVRSGLRRFAKNRFRARYIVRGRRPEDNDFIDVEAQPRPTDQLPPGQLPPEPPER